MSPAVVVHRTVVEAEKYRVGAAGRDEAFAQALAREDVHGASFAEGRLVLPAKAAPVARLAVPASRRPPLARAGSARR